MSVITKIKRALRGEVTPQTVVLETLRRGQASFQRGRDRARLQRQTNEAARLRPQFAAMTPATLLKHFQQRTQPTFFPGFISSARSHEEDKRELLAAAEKVVRDHRWPLLGLSEQDFGNPINWHRDPLSGYEWPLDDPADINLLRNDGSDVRVVWELNRLGHFVTLARAYSHTGEQRFALEFFAQLKDWQESNLLGRGVNWNCAMEVAIRALNLLGAFAVFRHATAFDQDNLARLLQLCDHHGRFIREHLEFSYISTSNHYLSDVVGLLWLGIMLPELADAAEWRAFGLREMLREMDKQVLGDGAHCESSTGYHRFVLELFAYSFVLCRENEIDINQRYWHKLHQMFTFVRAYLRPDGYAPLIGDSDSGQVFPIRHRRADDHAYLLSLGAVLFDDPRLKTSHLHAPPELYSLLGEDGAAKFSEMKLDDAGPTSQTFPDAGIQILRDNDLYLLFNASDAGLNGRGSHGHNDALSIEASVGGTSFIVDPGTHVYTADLTERHQFRSTAYHSTVQVDGVEQSTTATETPFVIGNEAQPEPLEVNAAEKFDRVTSLHRGYARLPEPVIHRRTVTFYRQDRYWLIEDELSGSGDHLLQTRFHFNSGLEIQLHHERLVSAMSEATGARLFVASLDVPRPPKLESQFTSRDYGQKSESVTVCWELNTAVPAKLSWLVIPVSAHENEEERLTVLNSISAGASRL